jgi:putative ABC transport system permease protein
MAWAQVRRRPARALALGAGVLVAAVCIGLLSAETQTGSARASATVHENFRAAYDILVRPRGAQSSFERAHHVVDDGFLSSLFGGITVREYREIRSLPGVALAAPVANVGYFIAKQTLLIPFPRTVSRTRPEVLRVDLDWNVHDGLSRYPGAALYLYWSPGTLRFTASHDRYQPAPVGRERTQGRRSLAVCAGFAQSTPPLRSSTGTASAATGIAGVSTSPYTSALQPSFDCAARLVTLNGRRVGENEPGVLDAEPSGQLGAEVSFDIPILIAGIDPDAESALVGLRHAIRSGHYLSQSAGLSAPGDVPGTDHGSTQCADYARQARRCAVRTYPVIASTRTYLDEAAHLTVEQLHTPVGIDLPARLASDRDAYAFITRLAGRPVARMVISPTTAWHHALERFSSDLGFDSADGSGFSLDYWRPSSTRDRVSANATITPTTVANDPNVWSDAGQVAGLSLAPPGSADTWYRHLTAYPSSGAPRMIDGRRTSITPLPRLAGTFDPALLRGFSALSRVPLQSFYPPTVTGADVRSRQALDDRPLGPTSNIAGYLAQPPLLLTTITGAIALEGGEGDNIRFRGHRLLAYQGASPTAPISTIQIRVRGVSGPNPESLSRIDQVAAQITQRTGLTVDITAGSSPTTERIALAAGRFGASRLLVNQGWVKKGVAVTIITALSHRDLGLIILALLSGALSVATATIAAVRSRRGELATLRALGWRRRDLFTLLLYELILIAVIAGGAGCLITLILTAVTTLNLPAVTVALITPVAAAVAVTAGLLPVARAAGTAPLKALHDPVRAARRGKQPPTITGYALTNILQVPGRSLLAIAAMTLGIASVTFLASTDLTFADHIAGNLLGAAINQRVRATELTAVALIAILGAGTLTATIHADQRERAPELATLRALGWRERAITALRTTEYALLAVTGVATGALLGAGVALVNSARPSNALIAGLIGVGTGLLLTTLGLSTLTLAQPRRDPPSRHLGAN